MFREVSGVDSLYIFLSSDTKATAGISPGAKGIELDTDKRYIFDGTAWRPNPNGIGVPHAAVPVNAIYIGGKYSAADPTYNDGDLAPVRTNAKGELLAAVIGNVLRQTQVGTDQTLTWSASALINTLKRVDITIPAIPVQQYELFVSNPSLVSDLNLAIYSLETAWNSETRQAKIAEATIAKSTSLVIEDCEDAWATAQGANVVCAIDGVNKKVGTNSAKVSPGAAATTGVLAYEDITAINLSKYTHLRFWIRSSIAVAANQLQLLLDDTSACASPLETLNIPALAQDTGIWVTVPLVDPTLLTAVASVGIKQVSDLGACDIYIDDVRAVAMSTDALIYTGLFNGSDLRITADNATALGAEDAFSSIVRLKELV